MKEKPTTPFIFLLPNEEKPTLFKAGDVLNNNPNLKLSLKPFCFLLNIGDKSIPLNSKIVFRPLTPSDFFPPFCNERPERYIPLESFPPFNQKIINN